MNTKHDVPVTYSYSYMDEGKNCQGFYTEIMKKLPKITLKLPKISLCENLELSFC